MSIAWVLILRKFNSQTRFWSAVVLPVSKASYGMYLSHMLVLGLVSAALRGWLGRGEDGVLGVWTTPVQILGTVLISYTIVAVGCILIQRIPKIGSKIMG